jgi:hypothetical protein
MMRLSDRQPLISAAVLHSLAQQIEALMYAYILIPKSAPGPTTTTLELR